MTPTYDPDYEAAWRKWQQQFYDPEEDDDGDEDF